MQASDDREKSANLNSSIQEWMTNPPRRQDTFFTNIDLGPMTLILPNKVYIIEICVDMDKNQPELFQFEIFTD